MGDRARLFGMRGGAPGGGPAPNQRSGGLPSQQRPGVGQGPAPGRAPGGYGQPSGYGGYDGGSARNHGQQEKYQQRGPPPQNPLGNTNQGVSLRLAKVEDKTLQQMYIFSNICAVSPRDFPPPADGSDLYLRLTGPEVRGNYVVTVRPTPGFPDGHISLSDPQREWIGVGMMDRLVGFIHQPVTNENSRRAYLGSLYAQVGFASAKKINDKAYDQTELAERMSKAFANQVLAPGQRLLLDVHNVPLSIVITTVTLADVNLNPADSHVTTALTDGEDRGVLLPNTIIGFFKLASSPIKLSGAASHTAGNAIIRPDFKFEEMGIGGLDNQFATIFRRAFASRVLPPAVFEKLGITHVKGVLLYGPPGTGKTLIARQLGKMLNAHEPKIINGPEVLNKYVGQSEENIRKVFADAEKEYKEKGDESQLHVIIFDELDAVCRQRGSGTGGGTNVGDNIVNQLLTKLDGVEQIGNVLLIGLTNRQDLIDTALLRPGRLEVQVEISLPDRRGRLQILKIHTTPLTKSHSLEDDVDLDFLSENTKNFSGAELAGLVRSATSFAISRVTTMEGNKPVQNDIVVKVNMADFREALKDIIPLFGASNDDMQRSIPFGILKYSPNIQHIMDQGMAFAKDMLAGGSSDVFRVVFHGPEHCGKTALATQIALNAGFPFCQNAPVSYSTIMDADSDVSRKDHINKMFLDAYKSPVSLLIIDNIEDLIDWNAVGQRFNNRMLLNLRNIMRRPPPKGHRLLMFITTSNLAGLKHVGLGGLFNYTIEVQPVANLRELASALEETPLFDSSKVPTAIDLIHQRTQGTTVGIGIFQVLLLAAASSSFGNAVEWFAEAMASEIMGKNDVY